MDPASGLILLGALYCGSTYGGSISASLLNTPGTPASAATTLDGFPMTRQGRGGEALQESVIASFWGGIIGAVFLMFLAPVLANISLKFGSQENALMAIFGLTIIVSLSGKSLLKGFISGLIGLLIATIGLDVATAYPRFTFNIVSLYSGISIMPAIVGIYSLTQLLISSGESEGVVLDKKMLDEMKIPRLGIIDFFRYWWIYLRSSLIGVWIGIVPGAGGNIAGYMAYNHIKSTSKNSDQFGKGCREGLAATESANNAVCGGSLVPMLTRGIPGNSVAAVLMGGLMIHGLYPGYSLFTTYAKVTYPFLAGFFLAQFAFTIFGLIGAKHFAKVVKAPKGFLLAGIGVLCVVGSFSASNNIFDVYVMLIFGIAGYLLKSADFDLNAIVLGMMLGVIAEAGFIQSYSLSKHNIGATLWSFVTRPISFVLLVICIISIVSPLISRRKAHKKTSVS
jgi:putative tricarboxylic transport membrane protein